MHNGKSDEELEEFTSDLVDEKLKENLSPLKGRLDSLEYNVKEIKEEKAKEQEKTGSHDGKRNMGMTLEGV